MTDTNESGPTHYILELSFDAVQITQALKYRIFTEAGKRYNEVEGGPLAGTFNFQKNDTLLVKIIGSAEGKPGSGETPELGYDIVNFTQVSIKPPSDQHLSLFDPENACTVSSNWGAPKTVRDEGKNRVTITTTAEKPLLVTAEEGHWKISGYLSVRITLNGKKMNKLYFFDPEGSAGSGGWLDP